MREKSRVLIGAGLAVLLALTGTPSSAQETVARDLLISVAEAMGGLDRLRDVDNFVLTGFGQRVYQDGGGNSTGDLNAPPKWRAVADAQRTFDLENRRALDQERGSYMFPFAAPFGHSWTRTATLQTGADMLDHPLPALLAALDPATEPGAVTVEDGMSVVLFTLEDGTPMWIAVDPLTHLPAWTRRIVPHVNLGDVAVTAHFTGYAPLDGVQLPHGLMNRLDWRNQVTLMFQVDSYRLDVPENQLPTFPEATSGAGGPAAGGPVATVTDLAEGVWDVRVGTNGGPVIEFDDHLVMFEAGGSAAATLARIDAANALAPGKEVNAVIVSHHHFDHTAGLRAAVSRGLDVISHRGNEGIIREMIERPAVVFPDALAMSPRELRFVAVDDQLVLEDETQRLHVYHVLGHSHMPNAVFAYLPDERIVMEGDFGDAAWTWHWWAGAMSTNIDAYDLDPILNVAVHGEPGGLPVAETLANIQVQSERAQQFCADQMAAGVYFFGCPVQYDAAGSLPLSDR
ncbi:MAG TPA: MBL fold metallo-hydrolase [Gammaproteobacteria bacterium]|nr:MBL fold metallo-hydrolase [Gammaproteobacteria bacterium]